MNDFKKHLFSIVALSLLFLISCEPNDGEIIELNCSTASTSGTITQGIATSNVFVNVSYTSDGEGSYEAQTIQSTGVLGLTATLSAGNFSDGSGTISYLVSGTPQSIGVASFAISVGGQSCTLTIQVNAGGSPATCGAPNIHNPNKTYGTLTDQEGNVYKTIVIGNQEWMAENLKTSIYRNGDAIANITVNGQWSAFTTTGAWSYFNNDIQYDCPYGKLYNWYAVADARNLCPSGWHVPTDAEWTTLTSFLGGESNAGGKMKSVGTIEAGTGLWHEPNQDATNESGFSGIPAGTRHPLGSFFNFSGNDYKWSSTEYDTAYAWFSNLNYNSRSAFRNYYNKRGGFTVRCLRD
jgi:uncharacterized protein (TIGR02145 family)